MHQNIANGQSRGRVSPTGAPGNGYAHDKDHMSLGVGTQGSELPEVVVLPEAVSLDRAVYLDLWRKVFGRPPPKNISTGFMQKAIAYERQCKSEGRVSKQTLRRLKRIAKGSARAKNTAAPLKPGTRLMREWNGRTYQVEVVSGGFVMEGRTYPSLSALAKHITGAHWSGPRFFGI